MGDATLGGKIKNKKEKKEKGGDTRVPSLGLLYSHEACKST